MVLAGKGKCEKMLAEKRGKLSKLSSKFRWIEVLPKLFQNLLQFEEIKLKNNEVFSSQEGKGILVNQFCSQEWNPDMLVHIVTTLRLIFYFRKKENHFLS